MLFKGIQGVIVHSDRGSQYCSRDYQKIFVEQGLICSMSKRGDCYGRVENWPRIVTTTFSVPPSVPM